MAVESRVSTCQSMKQYDYLLKFLLVGDSDVGKQEILSGMEDGSAESPFWSGSGKFSFVHFIASTLPLSSDHTLSLFCTFLKSTSFGQTLRTTVEHHRCFKCSLEFPVIIQISPCVWKSLSSCMLGMTSLNLCYIHRPSWETVTVLRQFQCGNEFHAFSEHWWCTSFGRLELRHRQI